MALLGKTGIVAPLTPHIFLGSAKHSSLNITNRTKETTKNPKLSFGFWN